MNSNYQQNTGVNGGTNTPVSGQGLKRSENELLNNAAAQPVPREQRDGYQHSSTAALGRTLNTAGQSNQKNDISNKAQTPGEVYGTHNPGSTGASIGDKVKGVFAKGHVSVPPSLTLMIHELRLVFLWIFVRGLN